MCYKFVFSVYFHQGDNVDFRALRAKFHAQAEKGTSSGGAYPRPHIAGHKPETTDNGIVRNKIPPTAQKPVFPVNPSPEPRKFIQNPRGVFPKPPPSHRIGAKEDPVPPSNDSENIRKVIMTGELLQNKMMQHIEKNTQTYPRSILPSQKSFSDVVPLRKPIPNVGPRPTKPKRPPSVNLDRFRFKEPDTKTNEGKCMWLAFIHFFYIRTLNAFLHVRVNFSVNSCISLMISIARSTV